jgi:hypothetical protein
MARHETARQQVDREDLLREATALVERVELTISGFADPIVCGFRRDGSASFYFGADPVYQFNTASELRRAHIGGRLVKAERGRLVALSRERTEKEVALVRHELSDAETTATLAECSSFLFRLYETLQERPATINGQFPPSADVAGRVLVWLRDRPPTIPIAAVPNAH